MQAHSRGAPDLTHMRRGEAGPQGPPLLSMSKKSLAFFDMLSDILTCVKMFSTVRESGGSLV